MTWSALHDPGGRHARDHNGVHPVQRREARRAQAGDPSESARRDTPRPPIDNTLIKAIVRAHRWKHLVESGRYASVTELAEGEKINPSYLCRVLRLTLLAPDIVEVILEGRQPPQLTLAVLMGPFPSVWTEQNQAFLSR